MGLNIKMNKRYTTLADRVKFARTTRNLTQQALARKSGLRQTIISKLETGSMHSTTAMVSLAKALQCSVVWLDSGKGDPWALEADIRETHLIEVPVVGVVDLEDITQSFAEIKTNTRTNTPDTYIQYISKDMSAYAIQCTSDGMSPRIKQGEYIVIEPNHEVTNGDEVLVKNKQGHVMVKQYAYKRDRKYFLSSINENSAPFAVTEDKIDTLLFIAGYTRNN